MLKKKIWANFQRIIEFFTQKIVTNKNVGLGSIIWDLEKKHIPDPGSRCQKGIGSRIRIRNTALVPPFSQQKILQKVRSLVL